MQSESVCARICCWVCVKVSYGLIGFVREKVSDKIRVVISGKRSALGEG